MFRTQKKAKNFRCFNPPQDEVSVFAFWTEMKMFFNLSDKIMNISKAKSESKLM